MKKIKVLTLGLMVAFGLSASAQFVDMSLVPFRTGTKWGFSDAGRNVKIAPKYDEVGWFSQGLAPVKLGSKWGYINEAGKMVIPARYSVAKNFRKGFMPNGTVSGDSVLFAGVSVRSDGYEVCIDTKGKQFKGCPAIPENTVLENKEAVKTVVRKEVYSIPSSPALFDSIVGDYTINGSNQTYYIAVKNGKYGVFNQTFDTIVPFTYSKISVNNQTPNTYLEVTNNDLIGLADPSGKILVAPENTTLRMVALKNGNNYALVQRGTKYYVRDLNNNDLIPLGYSSIVYDNNGFVIKDDTGLEGYYFINGKPIAPKYRKVEWVNDNFLKVTTGNGKVGYINTVGDEYFRE